MNSKLLLVAASLLFSTLANANLLKNGGAEAGDYSGWVVGGLSDPTVDDGSFDPGIDPNSGKYMFRGGRGLWGTLTQRVILGGAGSARWLEMSFWEQGLDQDIPSDDGYVSLTYFSENGLRLGTQNSDVIDSHDGVWRPYRQVLEVPFESYSVNYTMHFTRNFGIDLDAFFDDNSLLLVSEVPEPGSRLLGLTGLGVLAMVRYRRCRR